MTQVIIPTRGEDPQLSRWLVNHRQHLQSKYKEGQLTNKYRAKILMLAQIGVDVLVKDNKHLKPTVDAFGWVRVIASKEKWMNEEQRVAEEAGLKQLYDYLQLFQRCENTLKAQSRRGWNIKKKCSSLLQYTWLCLKVGDIDFKECTRNAPPYSMKYILSYLIEPHVLVHETITPTNTFKKGTSPYSSYSQYRSAETDHLLESWKKVKYLTKEELITLIHGNNNH
jgi:hypothetical protein